MRAHVEKTPKLVTWCLTAHDMVHNTQRFPQPPVHLKSPQSADCAPSAMLVLHKYRE